MMNKKTFKNRGQQMKKTQRDNLNVDELREKNKEIYA